MTSTASVTQQTLLLQLLQQEQLQQAAAAQADASAQTKTAQATTTASATATTASVNTSQAPQIGASFSAALSQLGSSQGDAKTHHGHHGHSKVDQAVQSYGEQGPSQESGLGETGGTTAIATSA